MWAEVICGEKDVGDLPTVTPIPVAAVDLPSATTMPISIVKPEAAAQAEEASAAGGRAPSSLAKRNGERSSLGSLFGFASRLSMVAMPRAVSKDTSKDTSAAELEPLPTVLAFTLGGLPMHQLEFVTARLTRLSLRSSCAGKAITGSSSCRFSASTFRMTHHPCRHRECRHPPPYQYRRPKKTAPSTPMAPLCTYFAATARRRLRL